MNDFFSHLKCGRPAELTEQVIHVAHQAVQNPIAMAQLLIDHGADVNQPFLVEGLPPRNVLSEAMTIGQTDLVDFLRSQPGTNRLCIYH